VIFVDDISRYDGTAADLTADRCDEAIYNVEDPGCAEKVRRWSGEFGKPWHLYGWEYPGPGSAVDLIAGMTDTLGMTAKAAWVDYEENGVAPVDAAVARVRAGELPMPVGFYTYLYLINSQDGLAAEWAAWDLRWIAYYPGTNDGSYPGWAIGDAQGKGAVLWQYTSSGGTRDRNVVVDEAKWATLGSGVVVPTQPKESAMLVGLKKRPDSGAFDAYIVDGGVVTHGFDGPDAAWGYVVTQQSAQEFAGASGTHPWVFTDLEWSLIDKRTVAPLAPPASGDGTGGPTAEQIAAVKSLVVAVGTADGQIAAATDAVSAAFGL